LPEERNSSDLLWRKVAKGHGEVKTHKKPEQKDLVGGRIAEKTEIDWGEKERRTGKEDTSPF